MADLIRRRYRRVRPMALLAGSTEEKEDLKAARTSSPDLQKEDNSDEEDDDFSSAPAHPTPVLVKMWLNQITNIDSVAQTFDIDVDVEFLWEDPRIVQLNKGKRKYLYDEYVFKDDIDLETIWQPNVEVINIGDGEIEGTEPIFLVKKLKGWALPKISMERTFQVTLTNPMDLRKFPFDSQKLRFYCRSIDQSCRVLRFEVDQEAKTDFSRFMTQDLKNTLDEWTLSKSYVQLREHYYEYIEETEGREEALYSEFDLTIEIRRIPNYYHYKITMFLAMVCIMQIASFLADADDLGTRTGISLTLILTAVAFQFIITGMLPRVSYLTHMDMFVLFSNVLLVFGGIESVIVFRLSKFASENVMDGIDRASIVIYVILVLSLIFWFSIYLPRVS